MLNEQKHPERVEISLEKNEKRAFCRCWKSKKFPLCDGSHREHNEKMGDKVGPVVVTCGILVTTK